MPGISGLEIAKKLREENSDIILIFVSAHEQYVFESIEYSPFRYIRKSRIEKELFLDLKAAYARLGEMQDSYIVIKTSEADVRIKHSDIMYFETAARKVGVHLNNGEILNVRKTIKELEISKDKKYSYRINEGENTVEIIGYIKKNVDSLHIPEKIDGLKVTSLGEASFAYHEELKCIKVPKTVTSMKMAVFGSSVNLEKVYFAGDVKNIDDWAFGDFAGTIVIEKNKCTKLYKYAVDNKISME